MAEYLVTDNDLTTIADAIRAKSGITEQLSFPGGFVSAVENISSGGGSTSGVGYNDVTFIDYDGTVLYSYTFAEAKALTELPALPTHDGLVCQGWNWTLDAIKALNRPVTVGAMYITDDGATRLHIRIATVGRMTVPLYIGQTVANGVSIDWGDGSTAETLPGTGNVNTTHTYAEPGDYTISLMPEDGCTLSFGASSSSYCVMGSTGNNGKVYCNMLQEVYIGKNVIRANNYAFQQCYSLVNVTIPDGVTSINDYVFQQCYSLVNVAIPDSLTYIGNYAFQQCYSLVNVAIPDSLTHIGNYAFPQCYSLVNVAIPDSLTHIGSRAFRDCYSLVNVAIPDGLTNISSAAFTSCRSLTNVTIPDSVTEIYSSAFQDCYSLVNVAMPDGLTYIDNYVFQNCYGMRYYDFSACTSIPTLSNTGVFSGIPSDCQMLIPAALFDAWKSATNWSTYASKMVAV